MSSRASLSAKSFAVTNRNFDVYLASFIAFMLITAAFRAYIRPFLLIVVPAISLTSSSP